MSLRLSNDEILVIIREDPLGPLGPSSKTEKMLIRLDIECRIMIMYMFKRFYEREKKEESEKWEKVREGERVIKC